MKRSAFGILAALAMGLGCLPVSAGAAFSDISGHWAENVIAQWQAKGYISGYEDGGFHPGSSITRAGFVKLLNRALGFTAEGVPAFSDVGPGDWFYQEVARAVGAGYVRGSGDGTFRPARPITRAEAAVMTARAARLASDEAYAGRFADAAALPAYAKGGIGAVAAAGIMGGYEDGSFRPDRIVTRAEAVVALDRVMQALRNRVVETAGTVLRGEKVSGDLIVAASVGEGDVTLTDTAVGGDLIIRGGGANSVSLNRVKIGGTVRIEKEDVHLYLSAGTQIAVLRADARARISGSGTVGQLIVSASGVTLDRHLTVRKTEARAGAAAPTVYNPISGSSGGSGGGTVTPPAPAAIAVTGAAAVSPVEVSGGTEEAAAMAKLPAAVTLSCADGSTVDAAVTWALDKAYDPHPAAKTVYTATGAVTIPGGYAYDGVLTVETTLTVFPVAVPVLGGRTVVLKVNDGVDLRCLLLELTGAEAIDLSKVTLTAAPADLGGLKVTLEAGAADEVYAHISGKALKTAAYALTLDIPAEAVTVQEGYAAWTGAHYAFTLTVDGREVTGVAPVAPVTVDYGTPEAEALGRLPGTVTLNCADGSTADAAVSWALEGTYDERPRSNADYPAAGTVTLPAGYICGGALTAAVTITVRGGDKTIRSIAVPAGFEVPYMTSETDAMKRLPSEVQLETYRPGTMVFAAVTWKIKDGQTYKPDTAATVTYVGTVTIPDGYQWDGKTTIEANIVILPNGETAKNKLIGSSSYAADVYVDRYTENLDEIKKSLPDQIRLQCKDDSWITVTVDKTKWQENGQTDGGGYKNYSFKYPYEGITLPEGYEFESTQSAANAIISISVKDRELEALQTALDAAWAQIDKIAYTEVEALSSPEKVYIAPDGTAASAIATGVKFVYTSDIEQVKNALSNLISGEKEAGALCNTLDLLNQDAIDKKAAEIIAATAAFQDALDQYARSGTGFTKANILENVRQWLGTNNSNYAYAASKQPLTVEEHDTNGILLPQYASDIQINAAGDRADIRLVWNMGDTTYAELRKSPDTGSQYVWVKGNNDEPKNLSLTVNAISYQDDSGSEVYFNTTNHGEGVQIEAYNNLIVGAPIIRETKTSDVDVDELTSGKAQTFGIRIPLRYNSPKIKAVDARQVTAQCSDGSLTGSIAVDSVLSDGSDQRGGYTVLQAQLTATTKQLDAVVDTDKLEPAKVTLLIPYGAVTLTDWAIEQGWYIPQDGLKLEADVNIYHPLVKVGTATLNTAGNTVTVDFSTERWGYGSDVRMALVPSAETDLNGTAAGSFVSGAVTVDADGGHTADISLSGITAGAEYALWVCVSDSGNWMKASLTYTHPAASGGE